MSGCGQETGREHREHADNTVNLFKENAEIYAPDGTGSSEALSRTSHLAVGAHPDDIEIMAFPGISECSGSSDLWFSGVLVTDGASPPCSGGEYAEISGADMASIRGKEQREAASVGGYSAQIQLGYSSAELKAGIGEVVADLKSVFLEARAETIYLHSPFDRHETHVACALRSIQALRALPADAGPRKVYGCEVWGSLDWLEDSERTALPVKDDRLLRRLLEIFRSQIHGTGKRYDIAVPRRYAANATFHESHAADKYPGLLYAVDLMPLVRDPDMSVGDFLSSRIRAFENETVQRIQKICGKDDKTTV